MTLYFAAVRFMGGGSQGQELHDQASLVPSFEPGAPTPWLDPIRLPQLHPQILKAAGEPLALSSLRGKFILLSFWATWCPPCREEMPGLIRLSQDYQRSNFYVIGVNKDSNPLRAIELFEQQSGLQIPFLQVQDRDSEIAKKLGIFALPTNVILDDQLRPIFKIHSADWDSPEMRDRIQAFLTRKATAPTKAN